MALNPIIEAFLAAREQASRDFAGSENRRLQSEEAVARQKHEKEVLDQQLKLSTNELAQRKAIADAEHALTKQQLEQSALIARQARNLDAARTATEWITKGLTKPTTTGLTGNEGRPVGQIGQMDQMLNQIPSEAPGVGEVPNVPAFSPLFGGDDAFTKQFLGAVTPHEEIRQEHIDDLEMASQIKQLEATQKELERFNTLSKVEKIKQGGLDTRSDLDRKAKAEEAEAKNANALEVAKIRANATLGAAGIRAAKSASKYDNSLIDSDFRPFIAGERSYDDLKVYPQAVRVALMKGMDENGLKFLNKQDQKLLDRAGIISETQRNVQDLVKLYDDGYVKNFGKIRAKQASIDSVLGNLARGVSGEAGVLTQSDIERIRGIVPTFVGGKLGTNKLQADQLSKYTKSTFGHILNGMRDEQAEPIVNRYGLTGSGIWSPKKKKLLATPPE